MPTKRPSPILLKEEPNITKGERIKAWVRGWFNRSASPPTERIREVLGGEPPSTPDDMSAGSKAGEGDSAHRATVQLLPGRLEPLIPEVIQQEVRFQRHTSSGDQEITLGWEMGDPPNHVTLDHPSIQPLHAKMTYQAGRWMIESLVPGDPVEVNGTPVPAPSGPYLLATGDQVRIGEALFRFHLP